MPEHGPTHGRRSVRLAGHDYASPGAYLITICTRDRLPVLGAVVAEKMVLSPTGTIVAACWTAIPQHVAGVALDAWAIRPDHVHGILILPGRGDACVAPTDGMSPVGADRPSGPVSGSVAAIVGAFKSAVTRQVNTLQGRVGVSIWQRGYYDQILWDRDALQRARDYVRDQQVV